MALSNINKQLIKRALFALLHAVLMLVILAIWTSFDFALELENNFLKWQSTLENFAWSSKVRPVTSPDSTLFIDVSKARISLYDSQADENYIVTDRWLLDSLLKEIRGDNSYRYVFCDIELNEPSAADQQLAQTLRGFPRIAFAGSSDTNAIINAGVFGRLRRGYTSYGYHTWFGLSDVLLKFPLADKTGSKSLPLVAYEDLTGKKTDRRGSLLAVSKGGLMVNSLVFNGSTRLENLITDKNERRIVPIRDVLALLHYAGADERRTLLAGKLILIGDYLNDMHPTAFGQMPGVLIQYNILDSLLTGENEISGGWLFTILLCFSTISYLLFYWELKRDGKHHWLIAFLKHNTIGQVGINFLLLYFTAIISFLLFHRSIEIIILTLYLTLLEKTIVQFRKWHRDWQINKARPGSEKDNLLKFLLHPSSDK